MKITKVIGYGLSSPIKSNFTYYGYQTNIKNIGIIEVHTDTGLIGFGETYAGVYCADLIEPTVKFLENYLIGVDIKKVNINSIPFIGRSGLIKCIYSGIDIAIYDILSKNENLPLCEYLGFDREIPTYASNGSAKFTPKQIEDDVKNIIDLGYQSYKMRIGIQDRATDLLRLEAAKKHLGSNNLMVDAIMGTNPNKWSFKTALEWAKDLEQFDVVWLEEPFDPTLVDDYSNLCYQSNINIAGGESLNQFLEFELYKDKNAVNIIQPDVTNSGGIEECMLVVNTFGGENTAMHVWGSQVAINANLHFAKALNVSYLEVPMMELEINDHINGNGTGIDINITEDIKLKYKLKNKIDFKI
jgi:L-alanine-DL-glutamate epimerase-like enolase superfamily enzyme